MRTLIAAVVLSLLFNLAPSRAKAQSLVAVLEHAGVSFVQGFDMIVTGVGRHAWEMARRDPDLALKLHTAAEGSRIVIEDILRNNPQLRQAVARRVHYLAHNLGLRGPRLAQALRNGRTYRGLRAGSVNPAALAKVMVVAATAAVTYRAGRSVGSELLRITQSHANSAEAEAYAGRLNAMITKIRDGTFRFCRNMPFSQAAQILRRNMQSPPYKPYRKLLCTRTSTTASAGSTSLRSGRYGCSGGFSRVVLRARGGVARGTYSSTYNKKKPGSIVLDVPKRNGTWSETAVGRKGRITDLRLTANGGFEANWFVLRSSPGRYRNTKLPVTSGRFSCRFVSGL